MESPGINPNQLHNYEYSKGFESYKPVISIDELQEMVEGNEDLEEILEDTLDLCLEYTETVLKMSKLYEQGRDVEISEIDKIRSTKHDATINQINILSRNLGLAGKDNSWIDKMNGNRVLYGKFAITITLSRIKEPVFDQN